MISVLRNDTFATPRLPHWSGVQDETTGKRDGVVYASRTRSNAVSTCIPTSFSRSSRDRLGGQDDIVILSSHAPTSIGTFPIVIHDEFRFVPGDRGPDRTIFTNVRLKPRKELVSE